MLLQDEAPAMQIYLLGKGERGFFCFMPDPEIDEEYKQHLQYVKTDAAPIQANLSYPELFQEILEALGKRLRNSPQREACDVQLKKCFTIQLVIDASYSGSAIQYADQKKRKHGISGRERKPYGKAHLFQNNNFLRLGPANT